MFNDPSVAIGLGMVIGLVLTESVGVTAGGIIVPGYIALNLHNPYIIITTFSISIISILILNILSNFIIIYGKRRLVFCMLLAFFIGAFIREIPSNWLSNLTGNEMIFVGYLIPGLIATWMDRQGIINTISTIIIIASFINLILMVLGKYV